MRLTKKKIKEILLVILGEEGLPLLKELYGKENVSEFDLAKKANLDIKVVRKMLYLLYNQNVVGFVRKKDKEKGWYIYYWTILPESVKFIYYKRKRLLLEKLEVRLKEEKKELFFLCPNNCARLNFDDATDLEFHCPECGELLGQDDNSARIKFLTKKIDLINKEFDKLREEKKKLQAKNKARRKAVKEKVVKEKVVKKKSVKKVTKKKPAKKAVKKKTTKEKTAKTNKKTSARKKVVKKKTAVKKKAVKKKAVKKKITKKKTTTKKNTATKKTSSKKKTTTKKKLTKKAKK